jgi:hypothetical protein
LSIAVVCSLLAKTSSRLVAVQFEDLAGVREQVNARGREWMTAPILLHAADASADWRDQPSRSALSSPIKCHMSTQRTQAPDGVDNTHNRAVALTH